MKQSTTQHTPGPWVALSTHPGQYAIIPTKHQKHENMWTLAYIRDFQSNDKANARLIAAAPELLEALQAAAELIQVARARFPKSIKHSDTFQLENTNAAINKAIHKATQAQ
jgi:hypothetical protein